MATLEPGIEMPLRYKDSISFQWMFQGFLNSNLEGSKFKNMLT